MGGFVSQNKIFYVILSYLILSKGHYVIEGNGELFKYILDYLRKGCLDVPDGFHDYEELLAESMLYDLPSLANDVRCRMLQLSGVK